MPRHAGLGVAEALLLGVLLALPCRLSAQADPGRLRVLVADFRAGPGADQELGEAIARRIRKRLSDVARLTAVDRREVERELQKYDLDPATMKPIAWRQLATRLDAAIVVHGAIEPGDVPGGSGGFRVDARIVETATGHGTDVPRVVMDGHGPDGVGQVAGRVAAAMSGYADYLRSRRGCRDRLAAGRLREAVRSCDRALSLHPDDGPALYLRGRIAVERRCWPQAVDYLSRALEAMPSDASTVWSLARAHAEVGHAEDAARLYRRYFDVDPYGRPRVRLEAARVLAEAGAYDRAVELLEAGVRRRPSNSRLRTYLGRVRSARGGVRYDSTADTTGVASPWRRGDEFSVRARFSCPGDRMCAPDSVALQFHARSDDWVYSDDHDLAFLFQGADRARMDVDPVRARVGHDDGTAAWVSEWMEASVSLAFFERLVRSAAGDYILGPTKGRLTDGQMAAFRRLLARIEAER